MRQQLLEQIGTPLLAGDARHLLVNLDRLGFLTDRGERLREQSERVEVLRVGLEADLELGQRLQAVLARAALQVELRGDPRVAGIGPKMQDALDDLEGVLAALQVQKQLR